ELRGGDLVTWAVRGLYGCLGEEIAPEINQRLKTCIEAKDRELLEVLCDARRRLGSRAELAKRGDALIAIQQMVRKFDSRGDFKLDGFAAFRHGTRPVDIGLALTADGTTNHVRVASLAREGPAYKAGIRSGDRVTDVTLFTDAVGELLQRPEVVSTN